MTDYQKKIEIRWSDLDPNFHVRHSVYYDFGAFVRMSFLTENGLGASVMQQHNLGPILFREECVFKREIHFGDDVFINLKLKKCSATYSRWTFQHEIYTKGDILSAVLQVDGAWLDLAKRKLTVPAEIVTAAFENIPRADDFEWIVKKAG